MHFLSNAAVEIPCILNVDPLIRQSTGTSILNRKIICVTRACRAAKELSIGVFAVSELHSDAIRPFKERVARREIVDLYPHIQSPSGANVKCRVLERRKVINPVEFQCATIDTLCGTKLRATIHGSRCVNIKYDAILVVGLSKPGRCVQIPMRNQVAVCRQRRDTVRSNRIPVSGV